MSQRQFSIFDAEELRDTALKAVEAHADPEWKNEALEAIYRTAERLPFFISDDVWESNLEGTIEDRALGPIIRKAAQLGWIAKTDRVAPSKRSHASGKPIWKSLLWVGE